MDLFYYVTFFGSYIFSITTFVFAHFVGTAAVPNYVGFAFILAGFACYTMACYCSDFRRPVGIVGLVACFAVSLLWNFSVYYIAQLVIMSGLLIVFTANHIRPTFYQRIRKLFRSLLISYSAIVLIMFVSVSGTALYALESMIPFVVIFLYAGIMLLRLVRSMEDRNFSKVNINRQIRDSVIFFAACILLTVLQVGKLLLSLFLFLLCGPIAQLLAMLFSNVDLTSESSDFQQFIATVQEQTQINEEKAQPGYLPPPEPIQNSIEENELVINWMLIVCVVGALILIAVTVCVFLMKKNKRVNAFYEIEEKEEIERPKEHIEEVYEPNDMAVRKQYKGFMRNVHRSEKLISSDTTNQIKEKYTKKHPEQKNDATSFSELYNKARYSDHTVSDSEVSEAKRLAKKFVR